MAIDPLSRRAVASVDPVAAPAASRSHETQLDLRLNGIKGKALDARLTPSRKNFAGDARLVGQLITDAIRHSDLTPQEAAFAMGYADQSALSRWMSGAEVPQMLLRFLSLPQLRRGLVIALARINGDNVRVETVVRIEHEKAAG